MDNSRTVVQNFFVYDPAVYAVGDEYCIIFNTLVAGMGWIEIDGVRYVNDRNGNIVSDEKVHKNYVPVSVLDKSGSYDIVFVPVYERKAYFPTSGEEQRKTYSFRTPNMSDDIKIYEISDTHSAVKNPVSAAEYFGDELDILIMNGDIPNHCGNIDQIMALYEVASKITHGSIPIVFSRGNHDTRGAAAIHYDKYTPTDMASRTYYTFRIGKIWGIVLDCGEDKADNHPEYGGMASFHNFRIRQTEFIKNVIERRAEEYEADGIEYRLIICHIPFDHSLNEHESEVYTEWIALLNKIKADVMLFGHIHDTEFQPAMRQTRFGVIEPPAVIGGNPKGDNFVGTALTLDKNGYLVQFTDKNKTVLEEHRVQKADRK